MVQFAASLSPQEIDTIRELFKTADIAKKGSLNRRELQRVFTALELHVTPQGFESLFLALDKGNDGVITLDDFICGFRMLHHPDSTAHTDGAASASFANFLRNYDQHTGAELFKLCDLDHDGSISRDELRAVLTTHAHLTVSAAAFESLWARLDTNGDGRISLQEFLCAMQWESARESNKHAPPQQQLAALRAFTNATIVNVIQTAQRAADKGLIKTAHACIDVIDVAAALAVDALTAEQCDEIAKIKALQ